MTFFPGRTGRIPQNVLYAQKDAPPPAEPEPEPPSREDFENDVADRTEREMEEKWGPRPDKPN